MESLFLVNPRRRKRRKNARKGKMPPGLARYWATHRRGGKKRRKVSVARMENPRRRRRRNPRRRHRARARNPHRRKVHVRRHRHHARRANPRRRRRHNPFGSNEIHNVVIPAAIGAGGAIALAVAYGYASPYLPSSLTTGFIPTVIQAAGALGLGLLAGKFLGRSQGNYAAMGGLTVVLVNAVTPMISSVAPSVPGMSGLGGVKLGGIGDYIPYKRPMGAYMRPSIKGGRLGFVSPAPVLGGKGIGRVGAYMRPKMGAYMRTPVPGMAGVDVSGGSGYTGLNNGDMM